MNQVSNTAVPKLATLSIVFALSLAQSAVAQPMATSSLSPNFPFRPPSVTLSASATASVPNDRMYASMRAESDNADPAAAASVVNARMGKALARAKAIAGVEASTSGYSSFQITDKTQQTRWRVAQTLKLEGSDFASLSALISQLQSDGGLVIDGTQFSVSDASRKKAEEALTQQAIKSWQARAADAARGFGFDGWRVGNVAIQTGDFMRPQPMMRQAAFASSAAPVAMEGGNSDVTVTVSGDAVLDAMRPR
ncbi:MAG: SIMPL domain-containing protein [Betaproteobacteria bacterium]